MHVPDAVMQQHRSSVGGRERQQSLFLMLQSCSNQKQLAQLHAHMLINGFSGKKFLLAKLLSAACCLSRNGHFEAVLQVFRQVESPSATLYNIIIRGACSNSHPQTALLLYNQMRTQSPASNSPPNAFTYSTLLGACSNCLIHGQQLHARIVCTGFRSNVFVQTSLLSMYAAAGEQAMPSAVKVFDQMPRPNVASYNALLSGYLRHGDMYTASRLFDKMRNRDVVSWTTFINACAESGRCRQALFLFQDMRNAGILADHITVIAILSACTNVGDLKLGSCIHACAVKLLQKKSSKCQRRLAIMLDNSIIHMYVKCGDANEAYQVFQGMVQRSTATWATMISGLAMHNRGEEALLLFSRMQGENMEPDRLTFLAVLHACSQTGRFEEGNRYLELMKQEYGIRPGIEHYGCLVDMLSRAGCLLEARQIILNLPMQASDILWGSLLGGCRMHLNIGLAHHAASSLIELHCDQATKYFVLLSNIYSAAQMWDTANRARETMATMGKRKPIGSSWIYADVRFHDVTEQCGRWC